MYPRPFPIIRPRCQRIYTDAQETGPLRNPTKYQRYGFRSWNSRVVLLHPSAVVADRCLSLMSTGIVARNRVCAKDTTHSQISTFARNTLQSILLLFFCFVCNRFNCNNTLQSRLSKSISICFFFFFFHRKKNGWYSAVLSRSREEPSRHNRH